MGQSMEQTIRFAETIAEIARDKPEIIEVVKEPNYWWIPIAVAGITMIGGVLTAFINKRKKEKAK